jgi:hypothetical protein
LAGAILAATVGVVLESTWSTPRQYLRLVPLEVTTAADSRSVTPTALVLDTVSWKAENWGAEALDTVVIRIGKPHCRNTTIVDGILQPQSSALVDVPMTQLHDNGNVMDLIVPAWPREGVLVFSAVFEGPRNSECYQSRILPRGSNTTLIVSHAPVAWVYLRATPLLAATVCAVLLLGLLGAVYTLFSRRGT